MRGYLIGAAALCLTACSTIGLGSPSTPAQTVYQAEGTYAAILSVEVSYRGLPDCGTGAKLCSSLAVVDKLRTADDLAYDALQAWEVAVRQGLSASTVAVLAQKALAAIADLRALTSTVKVS